MNVSLLRNKSIKETEFDFKRSFIQVYLAYTLKSSLILSKIIICEFNESKLTYYLLLLSE